MDWGVAKRGDKMAEARAFASGPRRRLRRPERGARMSSATRARFMESEGRRGRDGAAGEVDWECEWAGVWIDAEELCGC
jgi:hypothetical protein